MPRERHKQEARRTGRVDQQCSLRIGLGSSFATEARRLQASELLDWLKLLIAGDIGPETLRERDPKKLIPPLHGALIKNEQDVHLFERLAFMARREGR